MALGVIDFLQVGIVADRLDSFLQGNDFIVTGHDSHGAKLQTFGKMHGANRDVAARGLDVCVENLEWYSSLLRSGAAAAHRAKNRGLGSYGEAGGRKHD